MRNWWPCGDRKEDHGFVIGVVTAGCQAYLHEYAMVLVYYYSVYSPRTRAYIFRILGRLVQPIEMQVIAAHLHGRYQLPTLSAHHCQIQYISAIKETPIALLLGPILPDPHHAGTEA